MVTPSGPEMGNIIPDQSQLSEESPVTTDKELLDGLFNITMHLVMYYSDFMPPREARTKVAGYIQSLSNGLLMDNDQQKEESSST